MKLYQICEEEDTEKPDTEEVRRQIQELLDKSEAAFNRSLLGQLLKSGTCTQIIKACDKDPAEFVQALQQSFTALKPEYNVRVAAPDLTEYELKEIWAYKINEIFEEAQRNLAEGVMSALGGFFTRALRGLITAISAGVTAGALIGGAILGQSGKSGYYGGGGYDSYRRSNRSREGRLSEKDARKLQNATLADRLMEPVAQQAAIFHPILMNVRDHIATSTTPSGTPPTIYKLTAEEHQALGLPT